MKEIFLHSRGLYDSVKLELQTRYGQRIVIEEMLFEVERLLLRVRFHKENQPNEMIIYDLKTETTVVKA